MCPEVFHQGFIHPEWWVGGNGNDWRVWCKSEWHFKESKLDCLRGMGRENTIDVHFLDFIISTFNFTLLHCALRLCTSCPGCWWSWSCCCYRKCWHTLFSFTGTRFEVWSSFHVDYYWSVYRKHIFYGKSCQPEPLIKCSCPRIAINFKCKDNLSGV